MMSAYRKIRGLAVRLLHGIAIRWVMRRDLRRFRRYAGILSGGNADIDGKGVALIAGMHGFIPGAKQDGFHSLALRLKGYRSVVLLLRSQHVVKAYYEVFGLRDFVYFDDYLDEGDRAIAGPVVAEVMGEALSLRGLLAFRYKDVEVGKHALSWIVRSSHAGILDFSDADLLQRVKRNLIDGVMAVQAAERALDAVSPDLAIFNEKGYTPLGEIFDVALNRGIDCVQYVGSHKDDALHLKRYTTSTRSSHPISLASSTWEAVKRMSITDEELQIFVEEHYERYRTGQWYSRQELQKGKAMQAPDEVREQLGLSPELKTAVIFSHVLWDATFFYGEGLFDDYATWLLESVRAACQNANLNWIVKLHPANLWRLSRDGVKGELIEHKLIRDAIGALPAHVRLMDSDTAVNTASLFAVIDYCVTVRGTIGMEMPMFGVPVITGGTGRYSGFGFTVDSASSAAYLDRLARLHEMRPLSDEAVRLARLHAYAIFKLRPFSWRVADVECRQTRGIGSAVMPQVSPCIDSWADLRESSELAELGRWLTTSSDQDLFGAGIVPGRGSD